MFDSICEKPNPIYVLINGNNICKKNITNKFCIHLMLFTITSEKKSNIMTIGKGINSSTIKLSNRQSYKLSSNVTFKQIKLHIFSQFKM